MPTPRENTSIVKAPVLFRLPHLQHAAAAKSTAASLGGYSDDRGGLATTTTAPAASPAIAANTACGTTFDDHLEDNAEPLKSAAQPKSKAAPDQPEQLATTTDESFMSRWGFEIKRSVILLAAMALLWGAWAMGQKSATALNETNLAETSEHEPSSEPSVAIPDEPRVAEIVEPKLNSTSESATDFMPVTEPQPSFYGSDDVAATTTSNSTANTDAESDFSQLSLDALQAPSNGELYGDYDLGDPAQTDAQKLPVETDAASSNQMALNPPTASQPSEQATPSATNFLPTATPEMPGFDPKYIGNVGKTAQPDNRPVFSSTPNGIIDWSRYLPGAGGSGTVRAVSATQTIGGAASESQSTDTQAIYLDENDPNSPGVGVAPFYR